MTKTSASAPGIVIRAFVGVGSVFAITLLGYRVLPVNAATQGFLYLIAILFIATGWGLAQAAAASVVAMLCLNFFFLPPVGTFTIEDPQNWVALASFLITAITASRLSAQAKRRALEILERQQEVERLYALSRAILLFEPSQMVAKQVANSIAQTFAAKAVVLYSRFDHTYHRAGPEEFPGLDDQFRQAATEGTQFHTDRIWITAIRLGGDPIGSIGISGVELSDSALQSLANLAAIGLERARAQESATKAEVARQSDELKSTLLDAIAHEFQTPLTTIKAAASAMLAKRPVAVEQQADLLHLIDEETQRLSRLVSDAIRMARIEAGTIRLQRSKIPVAALMENVLREKRPELAERSVTIDVSPDLPVLSVDPELLGMALRQLIDNAVKYSGANSVLEISAHCADEQVILTIRDHGRGIPETELLHIFEKFYRGKQSSGKVSGAGLGLAIARTVVDAHGGRIWAESRLGEGSAFHIALPFPKESNA
ncbi:MAG: ATP-binding protein [Bryobacteraceae bacterium]